MSDGVKLEAELLPCPFCGSAPQLMGGHRNHWRVECPRCGVARAQFANGGVEEDKARAVRSWNTRKSDDGWRTMESAPKDGTEVLVYKDVASVPVVHIAWYRSEEEWNESGQHCGGWDTLEEWLGWWSYTRNSVTQERLDGWAEPSHWRPLPSPPEG